MRSAARGIRIPKLVIFVFYSLLVSSGSCSGNHVDSSSDKVGSCTLDVVVGNNQSSLTGCLPCSHDYLTNSYFKTHNSILDSDFHAFVAQRICSDDSCKGMDGSIIVVGLSDLFRQLSGEGSHRQLISTLKFNVQSDVLSWLDDHFCELVIIERLPIGVFADPFELQHLVQRKAYIGASVFGDTNLELPSAFSNRSIVEMHIHIGHGSSSNFCETVVQLPLHARYPPLNAGGGYAKITIDKPDLFLRCRPKDLHQEACLWTISSLDAGSTNKVVWPIPCGNGELAGILSNVTFISALVCSLLIVSSAYVFSKNNDSEAS
ncbi:phosphatidylinositol-glycan biosynthesis class X protein [Iris pallida]|uniref:Phosphatidylinositol-glycan biosynthesis class X protein n=1 Tax=Iris pallida TaxID=29817 RepID=A0AAX6FTD0_IRIPA|nr:phosphatidylinositol-glycan biosynthesis class X protein [Iris pallida]